MSLALALDRLIKRLPRRLLGEPGAIGLNTAGLGGARDDQGDQEQRRNEK
jgi:hypothetical protein